MAAETSNPNVMNKYTLFIKPLLETVRLVVVLLIPDERICFDSYLNLKFYLESVMAYAKLSIRIHKVCVNMLQSHFRVLVDDELYYFCDCDCSDAYCVWHNDCFLFS